MFSSWIFISKCMFFPTNSWILNLPMTSFGQRSQVPWALTIWFDQLSKLSLYINISCLLCVRMRTEQQWLFIIPSGIDLDPCSMHLAITEIEKNQFQCNGCLNLRPCHWDHNLVIDWHTNNLSHHSLADIIFCLSLTFAPSFMIFIIFINVRHHWWGIIAFNSNNWKISKPVVALRTHTKNVIILQHKIKSHICTYNNVL